MSITETIDFDKQGAPIRKAFLGRLFLPLIILLSAALGFGASRLWAIQARPVVKIENDPGIIRALSASSTASSISPPTPSYDKRGQGSSASQTAVVYASSGGKRYYYMSCKSTVSDKNKVTFPSAAMAEKAGYTLAVSCKTR